MTDAELNTRLEQLSNEDLQELVTIAGVCRAITRILDGKDNGNGHCAEPFESVRRRLLALVQQAKGSTS